MMDWLEPMLSNPSTLGILCLFGLPVLGAFTVAIITCCLRHRERMAMIQQGLHPDYPPEDSDKPGKVVLGSVTRIRDGDP